jgi:hypothetical protein
MDKLILALALAVATWACSINDPSPGDGEGGACSADGEGDGAGGHATPSECASPIDCTGPENFCQARTCTLGVCGFSFKAAGELDIDLVRGDCRQMSCDGHGGFKLLLVDDPRDDGNECTTDVCMRGETVHAPVDVGRGCAVRQGGDVYGGRCDGSGTCTVAAVRP